MILKDMFCIEGNVMVEKILYDGVVRHSVTRQAMVLQYWYDGAFMHAIVVFYKMVLMTLHL